jgi:hypothetical protein
VVDNSCETRGGGGQGAGGSFELGRGRGNCGDDLADHLLELAGDIVDPAAALDLGFGVLRGGLICRFLGDQCFLEDLQDVRHQADLGLLAPVWDFHRKIALAERLHGLDDRGDAIGDVSDHIEAHRSAGDDRRAENDQDHQKG